MQNQDPNQQNPNAAPVSPELTQAPTPAPAPAEPLAQVSQSVDTYPATVKKSGLFVVVFSSFVGILLLGTLGFSYYSAAVRIPDEDYLHAAALTAAMSDNIKAISNDTSDWTIIHPTGSAISTASATFITSSTSSSNSDAIKRINDSLKNIQAYSASLSQLKSSPTVQRDAIVKQAYADSSKKIESYKTEFIPIIDTQRILKNFTIMCSTTVFNDINTLDDYDQAAKDCTDFLAKNPKVPYASLNDKVYANMLSTTKHFLKSYRILLESVKTNDQNKYTTSYIGTVADVHKLEKFEADIPLYYITPPSDPTHELNDLRITLQNQQKVLFR
ncbi:MAG: hypothetical protein H6797_00740 [Candidatus Nomurabacteria bacterium]|nr:MAG: hypothetical protein H6797_00740 [Candidatus Nomurabacteria bacterium]